MMDCFSEPLQQVERTYVLWRGRKLTYFGGCDYFRLSSHPQVLKAARETMQNVGLNVAASRRTTGNHPLYHQLESATQAFFKAESAVVLSCGYLANLAVAQGLRGAFDHVYIDELAHSSLFDAAKLLDCKNTVFGHRNARDLSKKLGKRERIAVLTDGLFACEGARAPLAEYRKVVGPEGTLWVDDAHAAGVLGQNGRGTVEEANIGRRNVIQTVTFSKAFGAYGGAILCARALARRIVEESSVVAGNTPLPLPLGAAAMQGLKLAGQSSLRQALWRNVDLFWKGVRLDPRQRSPIIPVRPSRAETLKRRLLEEGIHPPLICYGGGDCGMRPFFRVAISSQHSREQIKRLARVVAASLEDQKHGEPLFFGLDS